MTDSEEEVEAATRIRFERVRYLWYRFRYSERGAASVEQILLIVGMAALAAGVILVVRGYVEGQATNLNDISVNTDPIDSGGG